MSYDLAVWVPARPLSAADSYRVYSALCGGHLDAVSDDLKPGAALINFYTELTARHPEIDDIPEERVDDHDYCPWSIAFDRSDRHIIMCCVWSKAEYVDGLVKGLATKHGLAVFDPQSYQSTSTPSSSPGKPWWKFW